MKAAEKRACTALLFWQLEKLSDAAYPIPPWLMAAIAKRRWALFCKKMFEKLLALSFGNIIRHHVYDNIKKRFSAFFAFPLPAQRAGGGPKSAEVACGGDGSDGIHGDQQRGGEAQLRLAASQLEKKFPKAKETVAEAEEEALAY